MSLYVTVRAKDPHALAVVLLQPVQCPFLAGRPVSSSPLHENGQAILCRTMTVHDGLEPAAGLGLLIWSTPLHCTDSAGYPVTST